MKASTKKIFIVLAVVAVVIIAGFVIYRALQPKEIYYSGTENCFVEMVENNEISELNISGGYKVVITKTGDRRAKYFVNVSTRAYFKEDLEKWQEEGKLQDVVIRYDNPSQSSLMSYLPTIIITVVEILFFLWIFKKIGSVNGSSMEFGKTKAQQVKDIKVRFKDVAGAEEEKLELQEIVDFLKYPKKYTDAGARIPRGVLLVGPPGTGKTLFAKAVAGEANVPFFSISGSDFVEMFVGVGASRVRDLFDQAKKNMPCIIFIDEIDAVGRQRGTGLGGGNDEREQTLNQLLVQMDGFEASTSIIVMAATNRADILDPALTRPGRFDRQIYVNTPDVKGREEIFLVHSRNKAVAKDVNFKSLARLTAGFTGADIENVLNESAILAARDNRKVIEMKDISEAINKVMAGPAKKSRVITETDKRITAYHESGHAIIAKVLPNCDSVHEVSIVPRGQAAGYTITLPDNDNSHMTKAKLLDTIAMMLGGRAAEEIVIKDISTGASNDIQRATALARKMVTEWGMSNTIGNLYLGSEGEVFLGRDYQNHVSFSDSVAALIDEEVKSIIDAQYEVAKKTLLENRSIMDAMVKMLFDREVIYEDEVNALFGEETKEDTLFSSKVMRQGEEAVVIEKYTLDDVQEDEKPSTDDTPTDAPNEEA